MLLKSSMKLSKFILAYTQTNLSDLRFELRFDLIPRLTLVEISIHMHWKVIAPFRLKKILSILYLYLTLDLKSYLWFQKFRQKHWSEHCCSLEIWEEGEIYRSLSQNFRKTDNNNLLGQNNHSMDRGKCMKASGIRPLFQTQETKLGLGCGSFWI